MFLEKEKEKNWQYYSKISENEYPDYLKKIYKYKMGKKLNLEKPKLFSEKIQWLKLYDNNEKKTLYSNKLIAPILVKNKLKESNCCKNTQLLFKPVLNIWNNFNEINFQKLPEQFILKANHGCNMHYMVLSKKELLKNKQEMEYLEKETENWLKCNYAFVSGFELQYKNIEPKLFAEPLIIDKNYRLTEVSIFCFNGNPEIIQVTSFYELDKKKTKRYQFNTFYDKYWQKLDFSVDKPACTILLPPLRHFYILLKLSKELSKDFKFVRIDFMLANMDKDIYFQEMTFTPYSGFRKIYPAKYDRKLGDLLTL